MYIHIFVSHFKFHVLMSLVMMSTRIQYYVKVFSTIYKNIYKVLLLFQAIICKHNVKEKVYR